MISKLGGCYKLLDSTEHNLSIEYRMDMEQGPKSEFLYRYNMPIYFAQYDFKNNKLQKFIFGFEYP